MKRFGYTANLFLALYAAPIAQSAPFDFSTIPTSGSVSALPGEAAGWGYSIHNPNATYWLVLTGLSAGSFTGGTPDASIFDYPILAPGETSVRAYNPLLYEGLFQFTWDSSAASDATNTGVFKLTGQFWSGDPFGTGTLVADAESQSRPYSVHVTTPPGEVPEPATIRLVALAIGLCGFREYMRRRC